MEKVFNNKELDKLLTNDNRLAIRDFLKSVNENIKKKVMICKFMEMFYLLDPESPIYDSGLAEKISGGEIFNINTFDTNFWKKYNEQQMMYEAIMSNKIGNTREQCPKCGKHNTTVKQIQDRAADEGSSNYYICNECSHTWKGKN